MKLETFGFYFRYIKYMPQFGVDTPFYAGYPIRCKNAADNILVNSQGNRKQLCLFTQ